MKIIYSASEISQSIMDFDKDLLNNIDRENDAILHFYKWLTPTITIGYFLDPKKYLNLENIERLGISIARRPTGGGITLHLWDMAFSFLLPSSSKYFSTKPLENYYFVNSLVLKAYEKLTLYKKYFLYENKSADSSLDRKNFCMAAPTKYDVAISGKKAIGAAQRKTALGYLHQGSISLFKPSEKVLQKIILSKDIQKAILENSFVPYELEQDIENKAMIEKDLINNIKGEFEKLF